MKKQALLVVNPIAGSMDVPSVLSEAEEVARAYKYGLKVYQTTGSKDAATIDQKLKEQTFERVLVAGGDGTLNAVASALIHSPVIMGVIPCGSANGLATSLQIPGALHEQLCIAFGPEYATVDHLMVNGNVCLHIADLGINANLIRNFERSDTRGFLGYAKQVLPTLVRSDYPYRFTIRLKEQTVEGNGILLAFANADTYGTGAVINPAASMTDGKFEVILFKKLNVIQILKTFFSSSTFPTEFAEKYCTNSVRVTCEQPISLQVDGEYKGRFKSIEVTIKPKSLRIAIPKKDYHY